MVQSMRPGELSDLTSTLRIVGEINQPNLGCTLRNVGGWNGAGQLQSLIFDLQELNRDQVRHNILVRTFY